MHLVPPIAPTAFLGLKNHWFRLVGALPVLVFALLLPIPSEAQAASSGGPTPARLAMTVAGQNLMVELAADDQSRQIGLMNRAQMGELEGMLFVFDHKQIHCMWMKNTLIDLDVAFMDEHGRVVSTSTMKAGTTELHCSAQPALYALELNAGWLKKHGVSRGQLLSIPAAAKARK